MPAGRHRHALSALAASSKRYVTGRASANGDCPALSGGVVSMVCECFVAVSKATEESGVAQSRHRKEVKCQVKGRGVSEALRSFWRKVRCGH